MYSILGKTIRLVAHRGANSLAPENTRSAILSCIDLKVDYIEFDVRSSLDGVLYNFHDPHLNRTTNGSGLFGLKTARQIDSLDAGSWFSERYIGEPVPRLENLMQEFSGKLGFYLDIKSGSIPKIINLLSRHDIGNTSFVWFGSTRRDVRFQKMAPHVSRKINIGTVSELHSKAIARGAGIVEVGIGQLNADLVGHAHKEGIKVMVNDNRATLQSFMHTVECGADMINLDYPERFADFAASYGKGK